MCTYLPIDFVICTFVGQESEVLRARHHGFGVTVGAFGTDEGGSFVADHVYHRLGRMNLVLSCGQFQSVVPVDLQPDVWQQTGAVVDLFDRVADGSRYLSALLTAACSGQVAKSHHRPIGRRRMTRLGGATRALVVQRQKEHLVVYMADAKHVGEHKQGCRGLSGSPAPASPVNSHLYQVNGLNGSSPH